MSQDRPDPSEELASELRQRVGGEFRADAEEGERLAELARLRSRRLAAVAVESRDRGDRVRLVLSGRTFTGVIAGAGHDYCTLRGPGGDVEIPLNRGAIRLVVEAPGAVEPGDAPSTSTTFRARLRELELDQADVEVGSHAGGETLRGRLVAVAEDHVVIEGTDDGRIYLAWDGIAYVMRRDDR